MEELIRRVESATGPSRELDAEIWWAVERKTAESTYWSAATGLPRRLPDNSPIPGGLGSTAVKVLAPAYTSSLDAALSLVPAGWDWSLESDTADDNQPIRPTASVWRRGVHPTMDEMVFAATPALALAAAALRARAGERDDG
jgi:hypothetical protein